MTFSPEESQEYTDYVLEVLHNPTFFEKIRNKLKISLMTESEIQKLRQELIDFKPKFVDYQTRITKDEFTRSLSIKSFDSRIETLNREIIIRMNRYLQRSASVKSENIREIILNDLCHFIALSYSINGWFIDIIISELKKKYGKRRT